jgi:DNA-binding transcriptional LysR family regulator
MPRMIEFMQKNPKLDVELTLLDLSEVSRRLEAHWADCILTIHQIPNPDLVFEPLFEEEMILICDPKHTLAKRENWSAQNIMSSAWVIFSKEDNSPQHWLEHRFGKKIRPVHPSLMVNDHFSMLRCLRKGKHIAAIPRHTVEEELKKNLWVEISPSREKAWVNQVYCGYRHRKQLPRKLQALVKFLTKSSV